MWTLFISMTLQAQILLHFIHVIRTYILQKFHSMDINLNETVFWFVYKNCFIFFILENLSRPISALSVHIQIESMHTEFKHLINERHSFVTVLSWQSKEKARFVPFWKDSHVTMLKKPPNPEEIFSLQEKCIALLSQKPVLLLLSGSLWIRTESTGKAFLWEACAQIKRVERTQTGMSFRLDNLTESFPGLSDHVPLVPILLFYFCASTQTQPPAPKPDPFPQHKALNRTFQQVFLLPLCPSFSWNGLLLLHSDSVFTVA